MPVEYWLCLGRVLTSVELEERLVQEKQRVQQSQQAETALEEERRQRQALLERLRELGMNPEQWSSGLSVQCNF